MVLGDWWKTAKFWLLAAVAVGFSVLVLVVRGLLQKKVSGEEPGFVGLPPAPAIIQDAANQAYEDSLTVKAAVKATTEIKKEQLTVITKIEDKKARRAALASFVNS